MNRYAMPVHPKSLSRDFESHQLVNKIPRLTATLQTIKTKEDFASFKQDLSEILYLLWFQINEGTGINLRDREKLYPVFKEIGRICGINSYPYAYRGVRLSRWDGNAISQTYPDLQVGDVILNPKEPRVVDHLEGLAYGLRSWTHRLDAAENWAYSSKSNRDKINFKVSNPEVVLDANEYTKGFSGTQPFDQDELILYMKNPQILSIQKLGIAFYLVTIKDN